MRLRHFCLCAALVISAVDGSRLAREQSEALGRRQESSLTGLPTLGATSTAVPSQGLSSQATSQTPASPSASATSTNSRPEGSTTPTPSLPSNSTVPSVPSSTLTSILATISDGLTAPTPTASNAANGTATASSLELPLQPEVTPALGIAGVILILTGCAYALIGVKNQWVNVFLSSGYLVSLAVLVLIIYVINPPVSNAVQGAYFVAVFMSGSIFGGGALVFKDITEGMGCLLGGYCLAMWFLTLKSGGLITNDVGKGIFIGIFCVIMWAFSFSRFTRTYALMFCTSFSGSTALVLGVDCFSKGGLKEFWIYLWGLNDKLFPLNTDTYPITRGCRVETIAVILGTIVGIISQVRLWRLVQNKQKAREAEKADEERRREVVEEAIARQLERQNDRDRSEWEKRYGNRLDAKRNTVLWSEAHGESKRFSSTSTTEVGSSNNSADSVEMTSMPQNLSMTSIHGTKSKLTSKITVHPILELPEEESINGAYKKLAGESVQDLHRQHSNEKIGTCDRNAPLVYETDGSARAAAIETGSQTGLTQSLRPITAKPSSINMASRLNKPDHEQKRRSSVQSLKELHRRSVQSLTGSGKSPKIATSPFDNHHGESQEALVEAAIDDKSRASSIAATLDEEDDRVDEAAVDAHHRPPTIVFSPAHDFRFFADSDIPKTPSAQSDNFDNDPEEMLRRPVSKAEPHAGTNSELDRCTSSASLTHDALNRVPSQMSNVVLSYRTNEWAKHIAAAEAPILEEPDSITSEDSEAATHLAQSSSPTVTALDSIKPPPLPSPVGSVAPSDTGVKVNPETQSKHRSSTISAGLMAAATEIPSRPQSIISSVDRRSFTDPGQPIFPAANTIRKTNVQTINEDEPTEFRPVQIETKRLSQDPTSFTQQFYQVNTNTKRQPSARNTPNTSSTRLSRNNSAVQLSRNTSQTSFRSASLTRPSTADTRLVESGVKTHQPLRRNNTDDSSRETMYATWRTQLAQNTAQQVMPVTKVDHQYVRQTQDFSQDKLRREQERRSKERAQAAMDQGMRTQGMIDAHKAMLQRMQSQANKKL